MIYRNSPFSNKWPYWLQLVIIYTRVYPYILMSSRLCFITNFAQFVDTNYSESSSRQVNVILQILRCVQTTSGIAIRVFPKLYRPDRPDRCLCKISIGCLSGLSDLCNLGKTPVWNCPYTRPVRLLHPHHNIPICMFNRFDSRTVLKPCKKVSDLPTDD